MGKKNKDDEKDDEKDEGYECILCDSDIEDEDNDGCPKCEAGLARYPALLTIAKAYKLLALIVVAIAGIGTLFSLIDSNIRLAILLAVSGVIGVITLLGASEGILVLMDIEENTRIATRFIIKNSEKK